MGNNIKEIELKSLSDALKSFGSQRATAAEPTIDQTTTDVTLSGRRPVISSYFYRKINEAITSLNLAETSSEHSASQVEEFAAARENLAQVLTRTRTKLASLGTDTVDSPEKAIVLANRTAARIGLAERVAKETHDLDQTTAQVLLQ
jgi:hypothetical protein